MLAGEEDLHPVLHVLVEALLDRFQCGQLLGSGMVGFLLFQADLLGEGLFHLDQRIQELLGGAGMLDTIATTICAITSSS